MTQNGNCIGKAERNNKREKTRKRERKKRNCKENARRNVKKRTSKKRKTGKFHDKRIRLLYILARIKRYE